MSLAINYPDYFPCVNWQYAHQLHAYQERVEFSSGWNRQRRQWPEAGITFQLNFDCNAKSFYAWSAWMWANGHDWFRIRIDDYNNDGIGDYREVRLISDASFTYNSWDDISVSVVAELKPAPQPNSAPPIPVPGTPGFPNIPGTEIYCLEYACDSMVTDISDQLAGIQGSGMWDLLDPTTDSVIPQFYEKVGGGGLFLKSGGEGLPWGNGIGAAAVYDDASDPVLCGENLFCVSNQYSGGSSFYTTDAAENYGVFGHKIPATSFAVVLDGVWFDINTPRIKFWVGSIQAASLSQSGFANQYWEFSVEGRRTEVDGVLTAYLIYRSPGGGYVHLAVPWSIVSNGPALYQVSTSVSALRYEPSSFQGYVRASYDVLADITLSASVTSNTGESASGTFTDTNVKIMQIFEYHDDPTLPISDEVKPWLHSTTQANYWLNGQFAKGYNFAAAYNGEFQNTIVPDINTKIDDSGASGPDIGDVEFLSDSFLRQYTTYNDPDPDCIPLPEADYEIPE